MTEDDVILLQVDVAVRADLDGRVAVDGDHVFGRVADLNIVIVDLSLEAKKYTLKLLAFILYTISKLRELGDL